MTNPQKYIASCYNGLKIWATNILPALLPFLVITKLLSHLNVLDKIFAKIDKITQFLFASPKGSGYIFGMSIISGYPVGAKIISDFYEKKAIDQTDANKLITFCSNSGPIFIIGTVGIGMLKSAKLGYILYFSHVLSSIFNGIIYRKKYVNTSVKKLEKMPVQVQNVLSSAMTDSVLSVLVVGGFVAIFYIIIDAFLSLKTATFLTSFLDNILGFKNLGNAILGGLIEVTRGCYELSSVSLPLGLKTPLLCAMITFGGMSIHLQSLCFLTKSKVNIKFYFLQKITQSFFAFLICFLLCLMLRI